MQPIIKPSSELRRNYKTISDLCKKEGEPIFLTVNGEGDTVIMDIETYGQRERELTFASKLLEAERRRLTGDSGYTLDELDAALEASIAQGEAEGKRNNV